MEKLANASQRSSQGERLQNRGMELNENIRLLYSTARHLTPTQIYYRGRRMARRQWWKLCESKAPRTPSCELANQQPVHPGLHQISEPGPWMQDVARAIQQAQEV